MKYLVMEVHPAYAVLLDSDGRFIKAANLNYSVGDTVTEIIPMKTSLKEDNITSNRTKTIKRMIMSVAAACLVFTVFGIYRFNFVVYGTMRMKINPDVQLSLSHSDRVIGLEGLNDDGKKLIDGYDFKGKDKNTVADELADRAIEMGYLKDNSTIIISVNADDDDWANKAQNQLSESLNSHLSESALTITIQISPDISQIPSSSTVQSSVNIPVDSDDDDDVDDSDNDDNNDSDDIVDNSDNDDNDDSDDNDDNDDTDDGDSDDDNDDGDDNDD